MLDIRFVREHPDEVKENIKKKFQDAKLPLVDEVINLDAEYRAAIGEGDVYKRQAQRALARLTGEDATEATIDEVFSTFCVGK